MNAEEILKAVKKYGSCRAAGRELGISHSYISRTVKKMAGKDMSAQPVAKGNATRPKAVKTLSDFRQAYDKDTIVPAKIKEGLAVLGPDGWEYEIEFAKMCGVSLYDMGRVRDKFADYIVPVNRNTKRAWAGSKSLASKMKEMV